MDERPLLLGIVGDSAAGKTTFARGVAAILGRNRVATVCTDDYHRYNRRQRREMGLSALDPRCNYMDIMVQHLELLRAGQPILKPVYNHATGDFDPPCYVTPAPFIIVEGLLAFATPRHRACFDVKVYLDPPEEIRATWKITRDTARRGYTRQEVLEALRRREPVSEAHIRPQRAAADVVVRFHDPVGKRDSAHLNARLTLRASLPHPDFSSLVREDGRNGPLRLEVGRDSGYLAEFLEIEGGISDDRAGELAETIWAQLRDARRPHPPEVGSFRAGPDRLHSHPLAASQLLVACHLIQLQDELVRRRRIRVPAPMGRR